MSSSWSEFARRLAYVATTLVLIASQNLIAWGVSQSFAEDRPLDLEFWLTPLSSAMAISNLLPIWGAAIFAYFLLVAWVLALLSFQLARRTNRGFTLQC